ncbi:hypothetical protein SULI_05515 [Saccharolobus solfataricus]|uniref:Uncharacterized protein n=3 Tax=Saccharolobus solfataricus TaxID=2287 RepID=Q7LXY6_SACS2|nr:hypothetical protein [Saccharolobus solfataricus]AAK40463.1 Hypothetical protein SSO0108 [Saccharolobus solfataricus P2]AKA73448.1 hypothetical protein SULB_1123 [Saccharolobus solfataricus]AKA76146.1 hypothetical protein SULC_1121 [Saccharolobus solfataricus]AKA78838.1 hypothetical protein SULA_1122 [Saccharolobus solfataricus]AZF67913.1 hypothetical protein SULG_05515 [Saccharolobus solfataricus]
MSSVTEDNLKPNIVLLSTSDLEQEIRQLTEELKNVKDNNNEEHKKLYALVDNITRTLNWINIAKSQGIWKSKTCKHAINFVCQAWNISDESKLGIPSDVIVINDDGTKRVVVSKFSEICIVCPLYEARRS